MKTERFVNTFAKGMWQDIDNLQQGQNTYVYALNGRVTYNIDGTYAWQNANGTDFRLRITPNYNIGANNYVPIGGVEINNKLVLFLSNGVNSEIGLVTEAAYGSFVYQTMFNDLYDPFGAKLNFSQLHPMRDYEVVTENSLIENVYFNDNFNEPRVFNILLGALPVVYNGTAYFATPYAQPYPSYYSVHGMAQMIDLTWGLCKFKQTITGELLSGSYQYFYRYIHQTGYATPWSTGTGQVFVTLDAINANWTQYQMQNSNAQSTKGNLLEIDFLDVRFSQVEVAALYWETDAAPANAYTFFKGNITGASILVQHQFQGTQIAVDSLVQRYAEISKAKTGNLKDNVRILANYSVFPLLEINTTNIQVSPIKKLMLSDNSRLATTTPLTASQPSGQGGLADGVTINMTDGVPVTYDIISDYINYKGVQWSSILRGHFGGEIYPFAIVIFDRKGQPFFAQHLTDFTFPTRYGNTAFDNRLSGNTAIPFGVNGDWIHTSQGPSQQVTNNISTDNFVLNLLGLKVSGIDMTDILYDAGGQLQVSGFSIVRTDRIKQILAQGLVMSSGNTLDNNNSDRVTITALPTAFNGYVAWNHPFTNPTAPFVSGQPYSTYYGGDVWNGLVQGWGGYTNPNTQYVGLDARLAPYNVAPYQLPSYAPSNPTSFPQPLPSCTATTAAAFFECPDFMIDNSIVGTASLEGDVVELVNICTTAYNANGPITATNPLSMSDAAPQQLVWPTGSGHQSYYQKNYRSVDTANPDNSWNTTVITPDQLNQAATIGPAAYQMFPLGSLIPLGILPQSWYPNVQTGQEVTIQGSNLYYTDGTFVADYLNWENGGKPQRYGAYQREPKIMFITNPVLSQSNPNPVAMVGCLTDSGNGHTAYFIGNYKRPIGSYTITPSLLQNRTYLPIGHFVPINAGIIATTKAQAGNNGRCIFNNVEVWGGDCFLDYFTYYRSYSLLDQVHNNNQDYSLGLSFPIESVFNTALRQGNTYDNLGPLPAAAFNDTTLPDFKNGLYYDSTTQLKLEDFNDNSVLSADSIQDFAFVSKPANFIPVYDFPVNEISTGTKIYGEQFDTFRLFPVDNVQSADGSKGQINSLQSLFSTLYIFQETAVARVRFNDRAQQTGDTGPGEALVLASNTGFQGHDYLNEVNGTQHQFSVVNNGKTVYFIDANQGKLFRLQGGIISPSDIYGMHNFFYGATRNYWGKDNPFSGGIVGAFDYKNQSLYHTFSNIANAAGNIAGQTIEFNEAESQFKSFHSFIPNLYFGLRGSLLSVNPAVGGNGNLYEHDAGPVGLIYGTLVNSQLKFSVNPVQTEPVWFDNGRIAMNNIAAGNKLNTATLNVQDYAPQIINFLLDPRWKFRQGFAEYPTRGITAPTRLRGKYMTVQLEVINDISNTVVRISSHETKYRLSPKL